MARSDETSSNDNALESRFGEPVGLDGLTITLARPVASFGPFAITGDSLVHGYLNLSADGGSPRDNAPAVSRVTSHRVTAPRR